MSPKFGRRSVVAGVAVALAWGAAVVVRAGALAPASVRQDAPALDTRTADQLAKDVFEIFKKQCVECHGAAKEGGLDLRTEEASRRAAATARSSLPTNLQKVRSTRR
jgi:mono/diheme cytochrome c family protein